MRPGSLSFLSIIILLATQPLAAFQGQSPQAGAGLRAEVKDFLDMYNRIDQKLNDVANDAEWKASTDVSEEHTGQRVGAAQAKAVFEGSTYIIEKTKNYLKSRDQLDEMSVRQLETILYDAADYPGTIPEVVTARVAAEARQSAILDGFEFCYDRQGDKCAKVVTPNQIDDILTGSTDLAERKHAWEVSKQTGPALKPGLIELQGLRNRVAREMGFTSFFDLQVSDYGMSVKEMKAATEQWNAQLKPLYEQLHTWAKYKLAEKYKQPVPRLIPAHWLGNRWGQAWPGIVEGVDLDNLFKDKSPEWIVRQGEKFYVSLGMPQLPKSFWEKSDLYELPPDAKRKKNTHASAWHIDLDKDVRSLMSVKANADWFFTSHHELGHVYYYMAYSNPDVPVTLRGGANRAFHEAIGDLISIAARQPLYLKEIGVMPKEMKIDRTAYLLNEALDNALVFIPWSAGVMTGWEHDLYEQNLPPDQFNRRWWEYVAKYQGIEPPSPRGEEFADAATKTHINDDPAQYYDYAMAYLIKYQLHMYIAKNILKQDPHNCNYYGNKEVGRFLSNILKLGRTKDWRQVIKEATGEEISARAMLEYFAPVTAFLKEENKGRQVGW
ncbi:MAG TPA: M2 family metallopeptidase [Blastocatellia bacterium]|jgi:peptidyl-dipeptidase A|nr:M2 family metallopeptidase [Blastocatellia bacterium]